MEIKLTDQYRVSSDQWCYRLEKKEKIKKKGEITYTWRSIKWYGTDLGVALKHISAYLLMTAEGIDSIEKAEEKMQELSRLVSEKFKVA